MCSKSMQSEVNWEQLVDALRDELQEKGGLIALLNLQTEMLYQRDRVANMLAEEQISEQLRIVAGCTQRRISVLRKMALCLRLSEEVGINEIIRSFPKCVHPLLEALFSEVDRVWGKSGRSQS
jgi:hypothetical protein